MADRNSIDIEFFYNLSALIFSDLPKQQGVCLLLTSLFGYTRTSLILGKARTTVTHNCREARDKLTLQTSSDFKSTSQILSVRLGSILGVNSQDYPVFDGYIQNSFSK